MSLPLPVIDRLFARLQLTYGRDFLSNFEGLNGGDVKSMWGHELAGFANNLQAISKALESLPERAPNIIQFKNICMRYLPEPAVALPGPAAKPEVIAAAMAAITSREGGTGHKGWAKRLKSRDEAGEVLNTNQVRCYKNALGLHPN